MDCAQKCPVLVTGATGFIGGHLAQCLIEAGWPVKVLVRDLSRLPSPLRERTEIIVGDIGDRAQVARAVRDVQIVFHCAANVATWDCPEAYERTNVTGTQVLMEELERWGASDVHLVHISTVDVYGYPPTPCTENSPTLGGGFHYGKSKLKGENLVREICERCGIASTIVRPCNVIGPGSQFILRIGTELTAGMMLLVDGGRANAGLIYIENMINDLIWIGQNHDPALKCYNLRDEYDASWKDFVMALRAAIGGKGIVISLPYRLAAQASKAITAFYRVFLPNKEPLLHDLIVKMFGRTCGHSSERFWRRAPERRLNRVGFDEAITASAAWFLASRGKSVDYNGRLLK